MFVKSSLIILSDTIRKVRCHINGNYGNFEEKIMKKAIFLSLLMLITSCSSACKKADDSISVNSDTNNSDSDESSDNDIILTIASRGISQYKVGDENFIDKFNEMDNGYKIIEVDYGEYFNGYDESISEAWVDHDRELILDVMQGGVIDIIPNVFNDIGKYQSLAKQGAFADLNTFIENDPQIENDMLFSHVLKATEINDQLTFMPLSFSINTLIGKTKYVGSKENWTIDDLKQHWESAKEKVNFSYHSSKDYVYYDLLRGCLNSFIDYDNAKCYFNSDEFIELLDFINTFDEPLTYKEDVDYLADTFIKDVSIYGFEGYHEIIWNEENDDVTFVGYPSADGTGAMLDISQQQIAISALSSPEKQQGAWKFIKLLISEEYQSNITSPPDVMINGISYGYPSECGFPINYKVFQKQGEEQYINEGKENMIDMGSGLVNVGYLKKSEYDCLVDYINNIKTGETRIEDELKSIIEDEIFAIFAGEMTSTEAANKIQDRVSILVSERYG